MAAAAVEELKVSVKHGQESFDVALPASGFVRELMEKLQALTNVLPRGQKLIFKGRVLTPEMSLKDAKLVNGAKLMMMATQGAHQGAATVKKTTAASLRPAPTKPVVMEKVNLPARSRVETWRSTGIVSLADCRLEGVPADVWSLGPAARVLDLSATMVKALPSGISTLTSLQRLNLRGNNFEDASVSWEALSGLKLLVILVLDDNCLTCLPPEIHQLSSLKQLLISNNKLLSLPEELGILSKLEKLNLSNNRLKQIPSSLGECSSLLEVNISKNYLTEIPSSIGNLRQLKVLNLDNNALKVFPANVLKGCVELQSLSLHSNEVTMEALREVDGWKEFDARRKSKYDKQIDFQVLGSADGFDEGADIEQTRHW